jgi:hypothetical protein
VHENGRLSYLPALFCKQGLFHLVCRSDTKNQLVTERIANPNCICRVVGVRLLSLSERRSRLCL